MNQDTIPIFRNVLLRNPSKLEVIFGFTSYHIIPWMANTVDSVGFSHENQSIDESIA
jgi:hypothetical protein